MNDIDRIRRRLRHLIEYMDEKIAKSEDCPETVIAYRLGLVKACQVVGDIKEEEVKK